MLNIFSKIKYYIENGKINCVKEKLNNKLIGRKNTMSKEVNRSCNNCGWFGYGNVCNFPKLNNFCNINSDWKPEQSKLDDKEKFTDKPTEGNENDRQSR
jgi:hypothetical protein